jgi:histidinol dehydrogenase
MTVTLAATAGVPEIVVTTPADAGGKVHPPLMVGFFFADSVWQIYALAVVLNFGSAIFTPIYRTVIPGVVSEEQYP